MSDTVMESVVYNLRNDLARANRTIAEQAADMAMLKKNLDDALDEVQGHMAKDAEIELLIQALEDKSNAQDEWRLKIDLQAAEIERLRGALDEIEAKALKQSLFPNDLITSYDMRRIADIARAARKKEADNG